MTTSAAVSAFIDQWSRSGASERSNFQHFALDLCDLLGVPRPEPATATERANAYVFEKRVPSLRPDLAMTKGYIDLYRRGCFVMEAKQGVAASNAGAAIDSAHISRRTGHGRRGSGRWHTALQKAKNQGERYVRGLPPWEGRPPFVVVVDVGYSIELFSEFTRTGGSYVPFPDPQSYRIRLDDLRDEVIRERLRQVWLDPLALDPSRRSEAVTKEVASRLAILARTLEADRHSAEVVAAFLMRLVFTMFAEDVGLLPRRSLHELFVRLRGRADQVGHFLEQLWSTMNEGGFSVVLEAEIAKFNGGFFHDVGSLPITDEGLEVLIEASAADWREVEPAIFGTLLERALDPKERHMLGAHFTPRAYVERLIRPTVIEPLRQEWLGVQAAASQHVAKGELRQAESVLRGFHSRLAGFKVLDPACGTGNFLYVALEHMKRLEGEVLEHITEVTGKSATPLAMENAAVSPEQFLGLELNPRAAAIAELVLWLGYLQWHFRTRGDEPVPEPILRDFHNVRLQDAVLNCETIEHDNDGTMTRCKGASVPTWPKAHVVVGNPPFHWYSRMREAFGDVYVDALQSVWPDVPRKSDNVMKWWHRSANLLRAGEIERFGFITTNSIRQTSNRKIVQGHLNAQDDAISIVYAIPDHPWVDAETADASVRISMTVCERGRDRVGTLDEVFAESGVPEPADEDTVESLARTRARINSDLSVGIDTTRVVKLEANSGLSAVGLKAIGPEGTDGFVVAKAKAEELGLGRRDGLEAHIRPFRNWDDLVGRCRDLYLVDLYGLEERDVRQRFPEVYEHLLHEVHDYRADHSNRAFREKWWVVGHPRPVFRKFTAGLKRYIVTGETSKHRIFLFQHPPTLPESSLVAIGLEDAYFLGVLSSRPHVLWSNRVGGRQGVGNDPRYFHTTCFQTFPFPYADVDAVQNIRDLAEELHAIRSQSTAAGRHSSLTDIYNVVVKIRQGAVLSQDEKRIDAASHASIISRVHDELDDAVLQLFGLPPSATDEQVLAHLTRLSSTRWSRERQGEVLYLRGSFQNPEGTTRAVPVLEAVSEIGEAARKLPWPRSLPQRARAIRELFDVAEEPLTPEEVASTFHGARRAQVSELLETLAELGQIEQLEGSRFSA